MDGDLVEVLKRTPMSPEALEMSKGMLPDRGPFVHPDLPGVEFTTRRSLKKAFSIQRYNSNTLRKRSMNRLQSALRDILFMNGVNVPKMARSMIQEKLASAPVLKDGPISVMIREIVREELAAIMGGPRPGGNGAQAAMQSYIAGIAKKEVRKMVIDSINVDLSVSGRAWVNKDGRRAMALGEE